MSPFVPAPSEEEQAKIAALTIAAPAGTATFTYGASKDWSYKGGTA